MVQGDLIIIFTVEEPGLSNGLRHPELQHDRKGPQLQLPDSPKPSLSKPLVELSTTPSPEAEGTPTARRSKVSVEEFWTKLNEEEATEAEKQFEAWNSAAATIQVAWAAWKQRQDR